MRLKYLSLNRIVDAAYQCGLENTPVSVLIAAPPGAGKTWSAKSIRDVDFVTYLNHVYSPNEHRHIVAKGAARTRLLINDDLGLAARWNQKEFFSTFVMICDGEISFTQWKQHQHAQLQCSLVLLCTTDYYVSNRDDMRAMGLLDRVVPVVLGLSQETRHQYQTAIQQTRRSRIPPPRFPELTERMDYKDEFILQKDIEPRLLQNLTSVSRFLTDDEFCELVAIAHSEDRYEV